MIKIKGFHDWFFATSVFFILMIILFLMGFSFGAGLEFLRIILK